MDELTQASGFEIALEAELGTFNDDTRFEELQEELQYSPFLELTMADHFALHALGIDWDDCTDTRP